MSFAYLAPHFKNQFRIKRFVVVVVVFTLFPSTGYAVLAAGRNRCRLFAHDRHALRGLGHSRSL